MSAETSGDVSLIKDEDVLRRMCQDTEDFGKKKEIRSHMYKLREERLRNFYTSNESTNEIHRTQSTPGLHEKTITQGNGPTHADSLADHSFLSLKSKEIRDSESPIKEMLHFKTSDKRRGGNQGWDVVSKNEVSSDGKTYTTSKIATTSGSENVDGVHANYAAKCEQTSSTFNDGDQDNFTKSSATSAKSVIKQEAKGGDDNSNFQSFSTSSSSSSRVVTQHHSTTGDTTDIRPVPSAINDSSSNQIIRKVYTNDVPAELKRSPNYIDGNTKVTTETRTLPDGSKVTTTRYETRGISTSSDKYSNTQQVSQQRSSTTQNTQNIKYVTDTFDNEPPSTTIKVYKTSNDDVERNVAQDVSKTSSTVIQKSHKIVDSKNVTNEQNVINQRSRNVPATDQDDVRTIKLIRENEYLPRDNKPDVSDQRPTSTTSTTRKEVITTKGGVTKTTSENVHDTHITKVIREDEYGRHPKNERPDHEHPSRGYTPTAGIPRDNREPRKPGDVPTPDEQVRSSHVTKESTVRTTSQNIQDTHVTKIRENEVTRHPKGEQPNFERLPHDNRDPYIPEGRKPEDYPSKPGHYTRTQDTHVTQVRENEITRRPKGEQPDFERSPRDNRDPCAPEGRKPDDYPSKPGTPGNYTRTQETHVTKIRENEVTRHPKGEQPDFERSPRDNRDPYIPEGRKPDDYPSKPGTPGHYTRTQDTHVTKIRENEFTRRPKDDQPEFERSPRDNREPHIPEGRKPEDYPSKASTPGHYTPMGDYTPGSRTPASRPPGDNTPTPNQIITRLIPHSEQPEQYDFYKTNTSTVQTTRVIDQKPQDRCVVPDKREPVKPQTREEIITTTTTVKQVQSVNKNDYTSKRISVEVSPTHEAFARSLRAVTPDRDRKPGSTRSLKSSTSSLRSSTSPEKRPSSRTTPERKPTPDLRPSSRGSSPTKGTPTKRTPNERESSPKKTTPIIDSSTITRRPKNRPRSRSTSPTSTASDIEFVRNVDVTKTQHTTHKEFTDKRPTTLNVTSPTSKKPKPSTPTSPSKESPSKKSPQDKPFHRRDTYEERCRQILGITDKTTDTKKVKPKDSPTSPNKHTPHTTKHTTPLKEYPSQTRPGTDKQPKKHPNEVNEPIFTKKTVKPLCDDDETLPNSKQPGHKTVKKDSPGPYGKPTDKPGYKHPDQPKKGTPGRTGITEYQDEYCTTDETIESTRKTTLKGRTPDREEPRRRPERPDDRTTERPTKPSPTGRRPGTESPERVTTVTKHTNQYHTTDETIESTRKTPVSPERPYTRRPETDTPDRGVPRRPTEPQSGRPTRPGTEAPEDTTKITQYTDEYHSTRTTKIPKGKGPDEPQKPEDSEYPDSPGKPGRPRPGAESPDRFTRITQETDETMTIRTDESYKPKDRKPETPRDVSKYPDEPGRTTQPRPGTESPDRATRVTQQIDETIRTTWTTDKRPDSERPGQPKRPDEMRTIQPGYPQDRQPGSKSPDRVTRITQQTDETVTTDTTRITSRPTGKSPNVEGSRIPKRPDQPQKGRPTRPGTQSPDRVTEYTDDYCTTDETLVETTRKTLPRGATSPDRPRRPGTESPERITRITQQTDETTMDTTKKTIWPVGKRPETELPGTPKRPTGRRPGTESPERETKITEYTDEYCTTDETRTTLTKGNRPEYHSPERPHGVPTHPKTESPDRSRRPDQIKPSPTGYRPSESPERVTEYTEEYYTTVVDGITRTIPKGRRPENESPMKHGHPTTGRRPGDSPDRTTEYTKEYRVTDETIVDSTTKLTTPKGRKPDTDSPSRPGYPHEPKTGTPERSTRPSTTGRKPGESPDRVTGYIEEYRTTDETVIDSTRKTTTPHGKKPGYPGEPKDRPTPGRKPEYTDEYCTTNETIDSTTKITSKPKTTTRPGYPDEPKKPTNARQPGESPERVTEYTEEYYTTDSTRKTTIPQGRKPGYPDEPTTGRKPGPDKITQVYTTDETIVDSRKTTAPKDRKPEIDSPTKPGQPKEPKTGRPTKPSTTGRSPEEDTVTEYTDEYCTTKKTIDAISKTVPKGRKPDTKPGYPDQPKSVVTGRPVTTGRRPGETPDSTTEYTEKYYVTDVHTQQTTLPKGRKPGYPDEPTTKPSTTGRRPNESPDRVTKYTDEYYTTDETVIDSTRKTTTPRGRKPEHPDEQRPGRPIGRRPGESPDRVTEYTEEYCTTNETTIDNTTKTTRKPETKSPTRPKYPEEPKTGRPTKPTTTGRKPGESPDRVTKYTEEYYTTDETLIDGTRKTTIPKGRKPERPDKQRPGRPTGRRPGESPDRVTEYTEEYCTTNETTIDNTTKTTRRSEMKSPTRPKYPEEPKTGRPTKPTTTGRRPGESPDSVIKRTEEYYTIDQTTRKTSAPTGKRPQTESPERHRGTTKRPDEPKKGTIGRKLGSESPNRVTEYTNHYYDKTDKSTVTTTTKRPSKQPEEPKRGTPGRPTKPATTGRKPGRESPENVTRISEYTDKYCTTNETIVDRKTQMLRGGKDEPKRGPTGRPLKPTTPKGGKPETTSPGRQPGRITKPTTERRPEKESPDRFTRVTEYKDQYYAANKTVTGSMKTPKGRRPEDLPDKSKRRPGRDSPDNERPDSPGRESPDSDVGITEYTDQYCITGEIVDKSKKDYPQRRRRPSTDSPDRVDSTDEYYTVDGRPKHPGRESPERVIRVTQHTGEYYATDEIVFDSTQRKTIRKTGSPERPRGVSDQPTKPKRGTPGRSSSREPSTDDYYLTNTTQTTRKTTQTSKRPESKSPERIHGVPKHPTKPGTTITRRPHGESPGKVGRVTTSTRPVEPSHRRPGEQDKVPGRTTPSKQITTDIQTRKTVTKNLVDVRQTKSKPQPQNQVNGKRHVVTTTIQVVPKTKPDHTKRVPSKQIPKTGRPLEDDSDTEIVDEEEMRTEETYKSTRKTDVKLTRTTSDRVIKSPYKVPVRGQSKPDVLSYRPTQPDEPTDKKVITTKSILINNDYDDQKQVIVSLHRSKSSREPTPDTIYPRPTTDEEDGDTPRYPDDITEPDEPNYRRKPTKLSDIPLVESEVTTQFTRYQQKPDIDRVDDSDECLLSVTQKVNKFVSQVEKLSRSPTRKSPRPEIVVDEIDESPKTNLTVDRDIPERPKSPKCQNYPDEPFTSVSDKVTHFTETTGRAPQKIGVAPKPRRPDFTDVEESVRTDHSLSVFDRATKYSATTDKPVSLSKMDAPNRSPRTQSPSKTVTECVQIDSEEDTYTRRQSKPNDRTPTKHESKPEIDTRRHVKKESPARDPDSTPKSSRKDDDPKSVLSPTARLRSTESVRKAKQLFENIAKEQKYPKDVLGRPSVFDRKAPKIKPGGEDVKLTDIGVRKQFIDDETRRTTYTTDQLKSVHLVKGKLHRPHSPEGDGDVPHYMRPLDRTVRPHSPYHHERSRSPTQLSESPRSRSPRPHDPSLDNVPHYMWPLDRTVHEHSVERSPIRSREPTPEPHSKRRSRDSSPDGVPGYMRPLDRRPHHDDVDHPHKLEVTARRIDSGRMNTTTTTTTQKCTPTTKEIEKILAKDEIEDIHEIELLEILLERTVSYEQRRRIRSQIRIVKQLIADNKLSTVLNRKKPKSKIPGKPGDDEPGDEYETSSYTYSERHSSHVKHSEPTTKVTRERVELKRTEPHTKTVVEEKPSWVTQRPLKKVTDSPKKTTSTTVVKKKESRMSPSKDRKPIDDITSAYGVGPTDENGSPLFGLRALRAQNRTDTTKVQGTVIRSHYYSENGQEPTGEVSVTKYSTDPNDFDDHMEETNGVVSVTTTQKFGTKGTPSYRSVVGNKNTSDDFEGDETVIKKSSTTSVTRRGSVKEMSKKFIDNAVETSKNERQASYPKAGLILRTSSFKDTGNRGSRDSSPENRETVVTTVKKTTTSGGRTDTFLNNQTRVRGVQDVITRMKNADDEVQPGDSPEDSEARTLLNKFIGSQVILSGMETRSSSSPSGTSSVRRTTTTTTTTSKGGGKPTVITRTFTHPITQEDLDTIWDEQTLQLLLERSTDYEERRLIRVRLRDVMAEQEVCADVVTKTREESSGGVEEKVETSKRTFTQGPVTTTQVTTRVTSQQQSTKKPISPFTKFRQLDKQNSLNTPPGTPRTPTGQRPLFKFTDPELSRQASTVKERLLQWCQMKTKEYENIQLDNFSTSWADGLAFCALIHHFLPDAFDYHALTPKDRRHNFTLAFRVADEKADILPLLDVDDMVATRKPDWKCVFTYVQTIYSRFKDED